MPEFTRLGTAPADRPGALRSTGGMTCPDVLIAGGRVLVIGQHLQGGDLLWLLPAGAGVGPGETVVEIPAEVFDDAARDRMADARLAVSEAQGWTQRAQPSEAPWLDVEVEEQVTCDQDHPGAAVYHPEGHTARRRTMIRIIGAASDESAEGSDG